MVVGYTLCFHLKQTFNAFHLQKKQAGNGSGIRGKVHVKSLTSSQSWVIFVDLPKYQDRDFHTWINPLNHVISYPCGNHDLGELA